MKRTMDVEIDRDVLRFGAMILKSPRLNGLVVIVVVVVVVVVDREGKR